MDKHCYSSGWRDCRNDKKEPSLTKNLLKRPLVLLLLLISGLSVMALLFFVGGSIFGEISQASNDPTVIKRSVADAEKVSEQPTPFDLKDLNITINEVSDRFFLESGGETLLVEASLDGKLQEYISNLLRNSGTLKAAAVVLRPDDGRILAMVSYDQEGDQSDLCLQADFPAASLFKIVAAAGALESEGFTPEKKVYFNGRKHTLYKRQLKRNIGKYTNKTTFKKAFGSSINPVFGKLGIYWLGQRGLTESAEKFLFNQAIPFDFPVETSVVNVPEDDFGLAEISSGFNRETLVSPLHAALISSAIVNKGILMKPWIIKTISGEKGEILYETLPEEMVSPISMETAGALRVLMKDTVSCGTCRKSFSRVKRKKIFKNVELGAKTGTINDKTGKYKIDWLTAYAIPPGSHAKSICIAILGVHGKKLGRRANRLGRDIINHYLSL